MNPLKQYLTGTLLLAVLIPLLSASLVGCGGKNASPKADAMELEQAFGLKPGAPPSEEPTPAGLASRAVAAIRAQDWPKAVSLLGQLRRARELTADQMHAVHNAQGNANVRLVELAGKGNAEAKAALDRSKREADAR
jgi:hypothetical protein